MLPKITDEQMAVYRAAERRRQEEKKYTLELRRDRLWEIARSAANLLKEQFGAQRVAIFGSALYGDRIHDRSDLDLAVWGMDERVYYRAVARLLDIDPAIPVDLVQVEFASANLLVSIEREGVDV